jgi:transposase
MEIKRIAMDPSKHVFTLVGVDDRGQVVMRRELKRHQVEPFHIKQAPVEVVLEACGGAFEPTQFRSGRHFAAWIGLTPKESSTGGKPRLGGISREGNERLRQLLVVGAMAVIKAAKPGSRLASTWLLQLPGRKPRKLAAVALANKMARIVWAMMRSGEAYRHTPAVG